MLSGLSRIRSKVMTPKPHAKKKKRAPPPPQENEEKHHGSLLEFYIISSKTLSRSSMLYNIGLTKNTPIT